MLMLGIYNQNMSMCLMILELHFCDSKIGKIPKEVEVHRIHDILMLGSCTSLKLCQLVDKSRYQSDLHPLLVVEGLASFLDHILNLLQFFLSFLYGFGNINSRHFTLGVGSSRSNREASRINSSGGSSDS